MHVEATSVGTVLSCAARRWPKRVALIEAESGRRFTYVELHERAVAVAQWLELQGVAPGDTVALAMPNGADVVAAWFGAVYVGATVVPISTRAAPGEVQSRIAHAGAKRLVECLPTELPEVGSNPYPRRVGEASWAMILYTSGTTGAPKGACISHASMVRHTAALVEHTLDLTRDDRVLAVLPLSHSFGCRMAMLAPFFAGASVVTTARFSASGAMRLMEEHQISWLPAVPTMFAALGRVDARWVPPSSLRWCLSAGAPLSESVCRLAERRLGAEIRQGYGMTEASFSTIDAPPLPARRGSVGRPVSGVEIRIVDGAGDPVGPGMVGHILIQGPNLMSEYLDAPMATGHILRRGWVHSGDLGRLCDDGWLTVVDRHKDVIVCGGFTVYPSEVEAALLKLPEVKAAAVIGMPDAYYGETVVAVVVPDGVAVEADVLNEALKPHLGVDKRPTRYVFTDHLPKGPSGKVLKSVLRQYVTSGG